MLNQNMEDMLAQYTLMINELQAEASSLIEINEKLTKEVLFFTDEYSKSLENMPENEAEFIKKTLAQKDLAKDSERLEDITSEKRKRFCWRISRRCSE